MSDCNANSYDLLQAQRILLALKKNRTISQKEKSSETSPSPYLKLSRLVQTRQACADKRSDAVGLNSPEPKNDENIPAQPFENWENCIEWCMDATQSEAVFVVDSQGFVIACRGMIPSQGYEGAGAEFICSLEQLERIAPDSGRLSCVDLDFHNKRLVGFVADSEGTGLYIVGLVAPEALTSETKHKVLSQISRSLSTMN